MANAIANFFIITPLAPRTGLEPATKGIQMLIPSHIKALPTELPGNIKVIFIKKKIYSHGSLTHRNSGWIPLRTVTNKLIIAYLLIIIFINSLHCFFTIINFKRFSFWSGYCWTRTNTTAPLEQYATVYTITLISATLFQRLYGPL